MVIDLKNEAPLIQAVFTCNLDEVQALLNNKRVDVNHQSPNGRIGALHIAAHCSSNFKLKLPKEDKNNQPEDSTDLLLDENDHLEDNLSQNYIEILKLLCLSGARINLKDSKSLTALHYACRSNSYTAVEILLEYQADVNSRDKNWQSPLHICAMYNSVECARLILPSIINIDATDKQGRSPLAHACFNGNLQMVELLLESGANCNIHDKQERKPIHWASYIGYTDIINILIKYGADINSLDKDLYTPLLAACASGKSEETIKLLIDLGADTNATTIHDSSVFHLACLNGHDQIIKELITTHNLPMVLNSKGYHPLHYAAGCKRGAFCVELLISLNIDVNLASYVDGRTPMHLAALHGVTSAAQILVSNGAQINLKDNDGNTPLHLATSSGQTHMVEFLVECGANIYMRGSNGMLAWSMAALNGHFECFKILSQIIPTISAMKQFFETKDDYGRTFMHLAAISGNFECLCLFINSDCDVNQTDKFGNTPLHYACVGSYLKCVELLVRSGAEVNEINETIQGPELTNLNDFYMVGNCATPLMLACAFDQDGYVVRELVLNARANANVIDKYGYNTLHYAALQGNRNVLEIAYYGFNDALKFLLRNNFDTEVRDANGRTPLDIACFQGEILSVECLLNYGANYETHDFINQRTPLHAAAFNNNLECLKSIVFVSKNSDNFKNEKLANIRDKYLRTPLMYAVEQGHLNTISFLINDMGSDILACDDKQRTALHRAAALGYEECCLTILKSNQKAVFQRDLNGLLPIHYAIMAGHANLINMFFEYQENLLTESETLLDKDGFSLLHFACFNGHSACAETICELGEKFEFLVEMLVKNPNEISNNNFNKFSPLHFACHNSHETCVNYFIEKYKDKLDILLELEDSNGNRPLHICAIVNEYDCAALLLEANCNLNPKNKTGQTPFMLAAFHNAFNIMELLLADEKTNQTSNDPIKNKIDLNTIDTNGNSALHLALLNEHENCALFILDRIESNSHLINLKNKEGQTCLHLAASNGFLTVVEILLSKGADIWSKNSKSHTPLLSCAKNDQVADCLELMISRLILSFSNKTNQNHPTPHTPSLMMMMGQNNSSVYRDQINNLNNSINELTTNVNNSKNLLTDSTYTLTTSDIILNDVNMNQLSNSTINENQKNTNNSPTHRSTNLNSTLIFNENEILESNVSSTVGSIEGLNAINLNSTANLSDEVGLFMKNTKKFKNDQDKNGLASSSESASSFDSEFY